jgi:hypothetical protein
VSTDPPPPRRHRERRTRSRTTDWHADREFANTVTCPPRPKGCAAPIGRTCRNTLTGDELVNQPAHEARMRRAEQAEPDTADAETPALDLEEA